MYNNHQAIYALYPQAVRIDEGIGAFDLSGTFIALDASAIAAKAVELDTEKTWTDLRKQRNNLIAETDYLALSDATMTDDIKTYRQTLRDLPANTTDPANPVWPTKPGGAS
jgi:hypothetical protein